VWVQDLVLDNADGPSSLAVSMAVELLEGQIDDTTANRVHWGTRSTLVAFLSLFLELKFELELLGSGRNVDLIEEQADTLWTRVRAASDTLVSHVPPSITYSPPDGAG
jgi:hypothetical protein